MVNAFTHVRAIAPHGSSLRIKSGDDTGQGGTANRCVCVTAFIDEVVRGELIELGRFEARVAQEAEIALALVIAQDKDHV